MIKLLCFTVIMITANIAVATEGVVLLHGLARTPASMKKLEAALMAEGYVVVNQAYPSRTAPVSALSERAIGAALAHPRLSRCTKVHFITHSLGGILVRDYLTRHAITNLGRVVMLGPPNKGSQVVDRLRGWALFKAINGPAGQQLGTDLQSIPNLLGPVSFELGIIAGDRSINWINSLMIAGPDDGKVSVDNTKVSGMKDHLALHVTHPMMMKNSKVIAACLCFLHTGSFENVRKQWGRNQDR